MNKQTEALKMAIETFMKLNERGQYGVFDREINACKEALEQEKLHKPEHGD